jgi:hypothetical protein
MPLIRARDLRANIAEMGFEKGVVHTLELALEQQVEMQQNLRAITELVDMCIKELEKLIAIGGQMKQTVDRLHRDIKGNVDGEQG